MNYINGSEKEQIKKLVIKTANETDMVDFYSFKGFIEKLSDRNQDLSFQNIPLLKIKLKKPKIKNKKSIGFSKRSYE